MATILKNIVQFTDLVLDEETVLPHLLNVNGIPVTPQLGGANAAGFEVAADETNVYVIRTAAAASGDVNVFVEYWHTIESVTPPGKLVGLTPFFFAAGGSGGGSGLPVTDVLQGNADLTAGMTNLYTTNGITTPFVGTFPPANSVPNGTLLAVKHNGQPGDGMASAQCDTQGGDNIDTESSISIGNAGAANGHLFVSDGDSNWWTVSFFISQVG